MTYAVGLRSIENEKTKQNETKKNPVEIASDKNRKNHLNSCTHIRIDGF